MGISMAELQEQKNVFAKDNADKCPNGPCTNAACGLPTCTCGSACKCLVTPESEIGCDPCKMAVLQAKKDAFAKDNADKCPNGACTNAACGLDTCTCGSTCKCLIPPESEIGCEPCATAVAA